MPACVHRQTHLGFVATRSESKSLSLSSALQVEDGVIINGDDPTALLKCG